MSKNLVSEILPNFATSREVWLYLNDRFFSKNMTRAMNLKTKLDMTKKCSMSLQEFFTKIKNLIDSLDAAGKKVSDNDHVMYILAGLGQEYDPIYCLCYNLQKCYTLITESLFFTSFSWKSSSKTFINQIQVVVYPLSILLFIIQQNPHSLIYFIWYKSQRSRNIIKILGTQLEYQSKASMPTLWQSRSRCCSMLLSFWLRISRSKLFNLESVY